MNLKTLWDAGKTGSQIAEALGMTRSAVMGRIFRLRSKGVEFAVRPAIRGPSKKAQSGSAPTSKKVEAMPFVMPKYVVKQTRQKKPDAAQADLFEQAAPAPEPAPEPVKAKPVTILELEPHHCRYIVKTSAKRGALYCAEPKALRSYCAEHAELCYTPLPRKGERSVKLFDPPPFKLEPLNRTRL